MLTKVKRKIYAIVEVVSHEDLVTLKYDLFDVFIVILISLNVIAVILGTVPKLSLQLADFFRGFEIFSVVVFSIEYILRLYSCTVNSKYQDPLLGRLKYIFTPLAIIDLLAILPFYLPMLITVDLRFLRALRLFRLLRVMKFGRYSESLKLFGRVLSSKKAELYTAIFVIFILLVVSSSLLYFVENEAQPDKFSSIPEAMWWGVVTLTTVGYGDIFPITPLGKVFGAIISFLGIGLFAMPAGILSAGFIDEIRKKREGIKTCPNCGTKIE